MNKKCPVSAWVGAGDNRAVFDQILEYHIAENGLGEFQPCAFCKAYGITSYDPDDFGGRFFPKTLPFKLLFHETPFAAEVAARCAHVDPANCYVLLHDYEYHGTRKELSLAGFAFTFIGVFEGSAEQRDGADERRPG
jgi:hypothetical protein